MAKGKITAAWRILPGTFREAEVGDLLLITTNRRTRRGWGPVIWWVYRRDEADRYAQRLDGGEVYQGSRYQALVSQAMYEAEQAAARIRMTLDAQEGVQG